MKKDNSQRIENLKKLHKKAKRDKMKAVRNQEFENASNFRNQEIELLNEINKEKLKNKNGTNETNR